MADELADWLGGLGLGKYTDAFLAQDVDLRSLPLLTEADLQQLGVSLGHRKILLAAIGALSARPPSTAGAVPASTRQSLPSQQPDQAERRQVSVLFCDMVGSTEISRRLDPEDLRQLLRDYQDRVAGAVARYGGHLAQYLGDGIMAFFGWPTAYEDQAARAIRAGLEAIAAIKALEVEAVGAICSRIAIATGEVVVGDLSSSGRQEGAIAGRTPNFAARLQQCAGSDQLVIDEATRLLVGQAFDVSDHGRHAFKGFDGDVRVFRVDGVRDAVSRFDATHGGALSRLVGRTHELAMILEKWALAKGGEGQAVLIAGEAGIGKSRFVRAVRDAVAEEPHVHLQIQCSPYHSSSALFPVIQSLDRALGLQPQDTAARRLEKLQLLLQDTSPDPRASVPVFAELLSLELTGEFERPTVSAQEMKALILASLVDRYVAISRGSPLLLVVEDAHWIDPTTFELIELIVARLATTPILMIVLHRPEWSTNWAGPYGHVTTLALGRLARPQIAELVRDLMGAATTDELIGEIALRTDGVPMFVEEVARSLVEAGPRVDTGIMRVPATLQGALMARLDGLLAASREVIQAASVMGREFRRDVIANACGLTPGGIDAALDELIRARLVTRGGTGADTFVFRHALIQDVAYQSLLRNKRQALHQAVADALAEIRPDIAETQPELLAHHLTEAGSLPGALDMWRRAGERAITRFVNDEAVRHFEKGLEIAGRLPAIEGRAGELLVSELLLGKAQRAAARLPEASATFARAADLARSQGDSAALIEAALGFDNAEFSRSGSQFISKPLLKEALSLIGESPDSYERCHLMVRLTRANIMAGEQDPASDYGRRAAAMARRLGDDQALAEVLILGLLVPKPGYDPTQFEANAAQLDELAAAAERLDNSDLYGRAMTSCFYRWAELGQRDRMDAVLARLSDYGERRQNALLQWIVCHSRALQSVMDGELEAAEIFAEEGLQLGRRSQGDQADGVYGMQMFTIRREQGRLAEVASFVKRVADEAPAGSLWRPGFALIASDLGFHGPAQRLLSEFAADGFAVPSDAKRSTTLVYFAEVCAALGDGTRAERLYELLKPYGHMTITAGVHTMCYGSAQRYLGILANTFGAPELAEDHFENALAFDTSLRAPLWIAHTQCDYGRMLRRRGTPADLARADALLGAAWSTAAKLGLRALTDKLRHLQM